MGPGTSGGEWMSVGESTRSCHPVSCLKKIAAWLLSCASLAPMSLLELENVDKRYGRLHALKSLSCTMPPGAFGLLGANGAGKSTLLKVLLGLLPFTGEARVFGLDVRRQAALVRARIGYMPEGDCFLGALSAIDFCAYGGELAGLPRSEALARAHAMLEFCGLGDKRYQRIGGYSTGMKQRVKLAQALVHDPELLILDEPTNGLDPAGRQEMLALIRSLRTRRDCSILLSSHILPDVESVCEQVILLDQGELRFSGSIAALTETEAENTLEVRVHQGSEKLAAALVRRGAEVEPHGALLLVRKATAPDIFALAEAEGLQVRHLMPRRLTLETAVLQLLQ